MLSVSAAAQSAHAGGAQSGHSAPKKSTLGASYARRSTGTGGQQHVPGKSGLGKPSSKATGESGLGSSRVATSKHVTSGSAGEKAPEVKAPARPARPVKTRAEKRAVEARARAKEGEAAAQVAEGEAASARGAADRAGMVAGARLKELTSAQSRRRAARSELAQANAAAETLTAEALADLEALEAVRTAAGKKKGSRAFRAFIAKVSFGLYEAPEDFSALVADLATQAQASARAAKNAVAQQGRAEEAAQAAEQALIAAEKAWIAADGEQKTAARRADQLAARATVMREQATALAGTAADLEDAADRAALRYDHRIARIDQHRLRLRDASPAAKNRFRREARRFKLVTLIESKPAEVTQDALAAAPEEGLFAIADGVTNSDYSGEFARALVRRWTAGAPLGEAEFAGWLAGAQAEWDAEVKPLIASKATAWYNRKKTWQGDAAFVGARLMRRGGRRTLELTGIGDTVAFLVRGGRIVKSFPLERAAEFSDIVKALPSVGRPLHPPMSASWEVEAGDEVFMGTDALSAWILGETEAGRDPLPTLRAIGSQKHMDRFVADARAGQLAGHGAMGVDDTALLRFVVPPGE
ncbi:MAG TPA: hypothetical protein VFU21_28015 [Kofleriaceae bacterium]|nr:hypothetical protein [Kofleriaceae bacterium]